MSIIEKIKAEVERLKKDATHFIDVCKRDQRPYNDWEGQWNTAELINKKLSTLQEKSEKPINPVCEGVEKEIERTANEWSHKMDGITISDMEEMFRHFYELGRQNRVEVNEDLEEEINKISKNEHFDFSDWKAIARHFFFVAKQDSTRTCDDLESEIYKWANNIKEGTPLFEIIPLTARHFAQWQKEQDDRLVDIIYQQGIEKGKDEMRETLKRKEKK